MPAACRAADEKQRRKPVDPAIARARRLGAPEVTLERLGGARPSLACRGSCRSINRRGAGLSVARRGSLPLREHSALQRISQLDEGQAQDIAQRLTKERWGISKNGKMPPKVPPWKADEIETFVRIWKASHGNT